MYMLHIAVMLVQRAVGMHDVTDSPFKAGSTNVCLRATEDAQTCLYMLKHLYMSFLRMLMELISPKCPPFPCKMGIFVCVNHSLKPPCETLLETL